MTAVCKHVTTLFFLQNYKMIPKLFCDYLRSTVGIHMTDDKDHIQKYGWSLNKIVEGTWRVGQKILFLVNGS